MKNKLFGRLGSSLKDNALIGVLCVAVLAAGIFAYNTIADINKQLENQRLQQIQQTPSPAPTEEAQDVQTPQNNVPLPGTENPDKQPEKDVQAQPESRPPAQAETPKKRFILPVNGKIYASFSGEELVYNRTLDDWRTHNGIDITAQRDDSVQAGADGKVENIYTDGMLGTVVEVDHGDFTARYCGLNERTFVKVGENVTQGQNLGTVGEITMEVAEESHIHLEIIQDGSAVNPDMLLK